MISDLMNETEERMQKAVEALSRDLKTLRVGRATPGLLDKVTVDYYGTPTPLNQLANISAPEPRLLVIQPWDKSVMKDVEKALLKSDLGLTPNNDGAIIRLSIPELTQERRRDLVKVLKKKAEEGRVSVRNIRREANDGVKDLEKSKDISEDDSRRTLDDIQKLTDKFVKEVDLVMENKEKEIMEI
jgi:ribosome recycling factor